MKTNARRSKGSLTTEPLLSLFDGGERSVIRSTFRRIEIAEEEIDAAKRRFPLASDKLHAAFSLLCPTPPLNGFPEKLFREHCRELLERVANGANVKSGTAAEVLAVLSRASLVSPLTRPASITYDCLFGKLFPDEWNQIANQSGPPIRDAYDEEQAAELEAHFRQRLASKREP